ncbi:hypothetical protein SKAU_G00401480 [Synaphobranchus kaupii]|uniref:Ribosomal protein n=1 Tax=Synaphobranchus kaupii TaxID=118154 RepID=A0A9Q1E956_SYNKA|nr:hypothetical protein SKAU_G00401480 [Synaphobranchus kaupii]
MSTRTQWHSYVARYSAECIFNRLHLEGGGAMTPLLLTGFVSSLTRQLSYLGKYAATCASPAAGVYRCMSAVSAIRTRTVLQPAFESHRQLPMPLLGRCKQLQCVQPSAGMKTKSALKRRCKDCYFVRRRGRLFVFCKTHPRHKQRQG